VTTLLNAGHAADGYARVKASFGLVHGIRCLRALCNQCHRRLICRVCAVVHIVGTPARKYQNSTWYFIVWAMGGREQATLFQTSWADIGAAPDTEEIEGNDFLHEMQIWESTKFLGQVDSFLDFGTGE
jgi:hypothetical protein